MKRGLFLLILTLSWLSCSGPAKSQSENIFILQNGKFLQTGDFSYYKKVNPFPWPVQIRITDMYCTDDTLFLLINRRGIAALTSTSGNIFEFSYFYEPKLFDNRTSTIFYPYKNSLICHVYEDNFLRAEEDMRSNPDAATFIEFTFNGSDLDYTEVITPLWQRLNPEWQAVVVNPLDDQTIAIEWKYTGKDQVKFEYSSFNFNDQKEEQQTREWFLATYQFTPALGSSTRNQYFLLFKACIAELALYTEEYLLHFTVTDSGNKHSERFFYQSKGYEQSPNSSYFSIPVIKQEILLCALLPAGKVLVQQEGSSRVREITLPPLPAHFKYMDIILFKDYICASWEDIRFTHVGAAGLMVMAFP